VETELRKGDISFTLIDVGGQRSERRKWLHCLDNIDAVLFIASLSEYDQQLKEDSNQNRTKESASLFSTICSLPWFQRASMILFLNKKDVFDDQIKYSSLKDHFPNYMGGPDKFKSQNFIAQLFDNKMTPDREIYRHFTCAKDTQNINIVFDDITDIIVQNNWKEHRLW
jgi:GTPase SAR1 family protein